MQQQNGPENNGTLILVMGILGLVACQVCAIVAWVMGNTHIEAARRAGVEPDQNAVIGRILGMVSVGLTVLMLVVVLVMFLVFGAVGAAGGM